MKRTLHFAGRTVGLHIHGTTARQLVDFMFDQLPTHGPARANISFELENCPKTTNELCFSIPGDSPAASGPPSQIVIRLLAEVDYHLADRCRGGLYLHAACLARAGQILLLPAASGSGKSTLTFWLTRHGFNYLSDESAFIPIDSQMCSGFTRPAHLKRGSLALFPELESLPKLEVHWPDGGLIGWLIHPSGLNPLPMEPALPLKNIVFPHYLSGSSLKYEHLSPARCAFELAGCLTNARNLPGHGFPEILRLARSLPAWRLTYGHLDQLEDFLTQVNW